jgi:Ca2+-binding EF-hand superfamily protein
LNANVVQALVNFKEYSDMRKLLCEVLSFTLMPDQITDLRREFEKLDTDGSGEISLTGLKKVLMQEAGAGTLGALGEDEVEDIFNAMRVRKTEETQIHWHEFIAAGLSQCKVDERNLRLAFDRLDSTHKGYITFENIMELMGRDGAENEDEMRAMWTDSMRVCNSKNARITYDDFLLLMKGQTKLSGDFFEVSHSALAQVPPPPTVMAGGLDILYECASISEGTEEGEVSSTPISPEHHFPRLSHTDDIEDQPLTMDEEDDFDQMLSDSADKVMRMKQEATMTPPQSPSCPTSPTNAILLKGAAISPVTNFGRQRSKSVDDQDYENGLTEEGVHVQPLRQADVRPAIFLPEHTHDVQDIEKVIHDETLTPLVVNRQLYRAHRKMRLAVLEASKRFEDQQIERTKAEIQARQQAESSSRFGAGLVMRRGHKKEVSSETIRSLLMKKQKQHETVINDAVRRSGRSRRARKKTVSDMSQMMSAIPPEDLQMNDSEQQSSLPELPDLNKQSDKLTLHDITKPEPTVPGVFRKTSDPFQTMGTSMMGLFGVKSETIDPSSPTPTLPKDPPKSLLKLSLSDGELNVLGDTPQTPDGMKVKEQQTNNIPPPPLEL